MTKIVKIGSVNIGGGCKIAIQSMTNTHTFDVDSTVNQIKMLQQCGCDIVRVAILDQRDAEALPQIKLLTTIPIVADIHFNSSFAISALKNGADKIRINPGNIKEGKLIDIISCAKDYGKAVRIGVNSGSVNKDFLTKYGNKTDALIYSLLYYTEIFESKNFFDLVLSLKSSSVKETVFANRKLSTLTNYPLHIGVTEAGVTEVGLTKNSIGIGALLLDGIGDTIRVSLTDDPLKEVSAAKQILSACGHQTNTLNFISCPTCGRCQVNMTEIADQIYQKIKHIQKNITVAVMGCAVNGPGEAQDADIGIAFGQNKALLFKKGKIAGELNAEDISTKFAALVEEVAYAVG